jgi:hypothetical protein
MYNFVDGAMYPAPTKNKYDQYIDIVSLFIGTEYNFDEFIICP